MTTSKLYELLIQGVEQNIAEHGFKRRRATQSFVRAFSLGLHEFQITRRNFRTEFSSNVHLGIRFNSVEEMVNSSVTFSDDKYRRLTNTIGGEIGNLVEGRNWLWTVSNEIDLSIAVSAISAVFTRYALPYFDEFSNMRRVFEALSGKEISNWKHLTSGVALAKRRVALAKMLDMREELPCVIEHERTRLKCLADPNLSEFCKFVENLQMAR
jgi:hypothetical protein